MKIPKRNLSFLSLPPSKRIEYPFLVFLSLFAFLPRFFFQMGFELNDDEASSVLLAINSFPSIIDFLTMDNIPPLYYFVLHIWIEIFGIEETSVRSLSMVCGTLLVLLSYKILKEEESREVAVFGCIMIAISPVSIYYSFITRCYSLLALLTVFTFFYLLRSLRNGGTWNWVCYSIGMILALYTHTLALFLLPAALISSLIIRPVKKNFIICHAAILLAYLPWFFIFLKQMENSYTIEWMKNLWLSENPLLIIPGTLHRFSAIGFPPFSFASICFIIFFLLLIFFAVIKEQGHIKINRNRVPFLLSLFVPLVLAWIYSFINPIYFVGRTDYYAYPSFCLLTAFGIGSIQSKNIKWILGFTIIGFYAYYTLTSPMFEKPPGKAFVDNNIKPIAKNYKPGDMVVFTDRSRSKGEYYLLKEGGGNHFLRIYSYPESMGTIPGIYVDKHPVKDKKELKNEAKKISFLFGKTFARGNSIWMFYYPNEVNQYLLAELNRKYNIGIEAPKEGQGKVLRFAKSHS